MPMLEKLTRNELGVLKNMKNANIVKFHELIRANTNTYYVYEYCNGGNLFEILADKTFIPEKQSISYFVELLNAFKPLVKDNIVHRDIKPENVLLHNG